MEILSRLFGSALRVKMMRLFLFNPSMTFDVDYIVGKTNAKPREIEKELLFLRSVDFAKPTKIMKTVSVKKGKKVTEKKKKVKGYALDNAFKFRDELTDFLVKTHTLEHKSIAKRLEKAGRVRAVLVSGVFMRVPEARLDLFVVADGVKQSSLERVVRGIESDMGKDIRYSVLSSADYAYRKSMNDKLIRDVFDFPHMIIVDKLGIAGQ